MYLQYCEDSLFGCPSCRYDANHLAIQASHAVRDDELACAHAHAEDNEAFLDDGVIRIVYDARVGVVEYGGRLIERDAVLAYIRLGF